MQIIKATGLHRKSGGAQWRDLRLPIPKPLLRAIPTLPFVISTEAQRTAVKRSAVQRSFPENVFRAQVSRAFSSVTAHLAISCLPGFPFSPAAN
jgi:hypothetical protein